ncbi:MAG TPA: dethiobiotin synthase [Gammaproteobacteria bacterium]|nr:dethiobiotin synthase [Gammaproteobacteria bacterium]
MRGFFITGTDTGVGKTLVAAGLLRIFAAAGLRAVGMKPVASGALQTTAGLRNADALALQAASTASQPYDDVNPYVFVPAIAPHLAAAEAGVTIEPSRILAAYQRLCCGADVVVVEGVGGWQVPLADGLQLPDLARSLGLPVILVVGLRLGCLNHAQLSARAIREDGLTLAGWVANTIDFDFERRSGNLATLKRVMQAPLLGDIAGQPTLNSAALADRLDAVSILRLLNAVQAE